MIVFLFTTSARRCLMYAQGTVGDVLWSLLFKWATLFLKVSNHCTWTPKSRITNGFPCKWRARLTHSTDFIWRKQHARRFNVQLFGITLTTQTFLFTPPIKKIKKNCFGKWRANRAPVRRTEMWESSDDLLLKCVALMSHWTPVTLQQQNTPQTSKVKAK